MIALVLTAALLAGSPASAAEQPELQCNLGPASERVGGNDWIVYGCADGKSVVVVAGAPNPAAPFVFILTPVGGQIELHGEGNGAKSATKPAYDQLSAMSVEDLAALYRKASSAAGR
ncbi:hypothetical protein [Cognatilysobacter lacus]|uniref:Secreted protein n=1 Tax=Cognatilysobacter lacus TaxID=1643323 RepID=A0A5D8Z7S9_9GAMM|nr:hypothetical protein [Lysobacter lacus]TZF90727.1 hypothetical protein FW784_04290 [Lysobacter lacus]